MSVLEFPLVHRAGSTPDAPPHVLVFDRNRKRGAEILRAFASQGFDPFLATRSAEVQHHLLYASYDLVVLSASPGERGLSSLMGDLRRRVRGADRPLPPLLAVLHRVRTGEEVVDAAAELLGRNGSPCA